MKYYIIAGERSGDLHAANLMRALQKHDSNAQFRGFGGDEMLAAGAALQQHYQKLAFMGFWEVLTNLFTIFDLLKDCKTDIINYQPDVIILVDYAGFNMRIAHFAKQKGFKVFYYISPKIWAWNTSRAYKIKRDVDKMFVIMPFEKGFYRQFGYEVDYIGNPLFDAISRFEANANFLEINQLDKNKPIIALLPGSRKQEVRNMLPYFCELKQYFPDYQFVVAAIEQLPPELYQVARDHNISLVYEQTYDLLTVAHAAVVTSGTATLETALFNVPQVVAYRTSFVTASIVKMLIKVRFASLVNLIAEKEVVKELLQSNFTVENLRLELEKVLNSNRKAILADYAQLRQRVETPESASEMAAKLMWKYLNA